ncbi:MAG: hypothetical protein EOM12_03425 [Verrucomicrobiae bacterium]|nr:hypothetical protein [Verrucomicrobiae bacterium]
MKLKRWFIDCETARAQVVTSPNAPVCVAFEKAAFKLFGKRNMQTALTFNTFTVVKTETFQD